jgi:diguanylate cyclase (GGDEF)-like protein
MKVLLAEDSRSNQMLISAYIQDFGHDVIAVSNGAEALREFKLDRPDLVIMDVTMPEMDGIEATQKIREFSLQQGDWVPIVFLSGLSDAEDILKGIEAGGDDYLTKPVDETVLKAKLTAMQRIAEMRHQLHVANRKLTLMTVKDGLTGLYNRRHFDDVIEKELKMSRRIKAPVSLILCDIDHFKKYNDYYGHQQGDDCLKQIAKALQNAVKRPGDVVARYGGEEFVAVLPETELAGAEQVAEAIRQAVEALSIVHEQSTTADHVTLSLGVACLTAIKEDIVDELIRTLIENADQSLYKAKEQGRNRVITHQE